MSQHHPAAAERVAPAHRGAERMMCRVTRRLHDEQGFRDLCAQAAPLRCRG